jgi:hypothetical protein
MRRLRKQRLEEHKKKETPEEEGGDEIHKATTVFHGVGGEKGFIEPP